MVTEKSAKDSSERQRWKTIYNTLVNMLQTQQQQLQSLVQERSLFKDRFQIQHDRWVSDVKTLEDQLSQMKRRLSLTEMERFLEVAKSGLLISLKQSDSEIYKTRLEFAESDLADFRLYNDYLAQKLSEQNEKLGDTDLECNKGKEGKGGRSTETAEEVEPHSKNLEDEIKRLKRANDHLTSANKIEVSALLVERDFVWNQYRNLEAEYSSFRKTKEIEVEQANEKIDKLLSSMEQLQSSCTEKDETIVKLKAGLAKLEVDSSREISRLSKEVEVLKNLRGSSLTPILSSCTTRSLNRSDSSGIALKTVKKESRGSKRKEVETIPSSATPRLFSSRFKIPKLKNSPLLPTA